MTATPDIQSQPGGASAFPSFPSLSTLTGARHRTAYRRRSIPWNPLAIVAILAGWTAMVLIAPQIQVGPELHQLALFAHLAALLLGFGAVLVAEWFGLLWILRRRPLASVLHVAHGTHLPIWLGLVGLALSGILLTPAEIAGVTWIKLSMVLIVALNGLYARRVQQKLAAAGPNVPKSVLARATGAALVSQAGWWTATAIGFLATQS